MKSTKNKSRGCEIAWIPEKGLKTSIH